MPWHSVNRIPSNTVIVIAKMLFLIFFCRKEWWDQVIVAPEDRRIIEFSRGISMGLKIFTPMGGHIAPNSIFGEILLWKNAQKNLKKNMISDRMNIIILYFNKDMVLFVWWPWRDDSRFKSRHHIAAVSEIINELKNTNKYDILFEWIL